MRAMVAVITLATAVPVTEILWPGARAKKASAVMGAAMWVTVVTVFPNAHATWSGAVRELVALMAIGAAVLAAAVLAMRRPELRWALGRK